MTFRVPYPSFRVARYRILIRAVVPVPEAEYRVPEYLYPVLGPTSCVQIFAYYDRDGGSGREIGEGVRAIAN